LLNIIIDDDIGLDEDYKHRNAFTAMRELEESSQVSRSHSSALSSSNTSIATSSYSSSQEEERSVILSSDEDGSSSDNSSDSSDSVDSTSSLFQLIDNDKDFITLNVMIQMEHCTGNTLREFLDKKDYKVNRKLIFHYFKQLINGLKHIHEEKLIHRDIKPANIFIDDTRMLLKIGDFGLAKELVTTSKQQLEQEIQGLKRNNTSMVNLHQLNTINTI
jgi:translation initiation factor 2-alpha kinase 4